MKSLIIIITVMLCSIITKAQLSIDTTSIIDIKPNSLVTVDKATWLKVLNAETNGNYSIQNAKQALYKKELEAFGYIMYKSSTIFFIAASTLKKYCITITGYINDNKYWVLDPISYPF